MNYKIKDKTIIELSKQPEFGVNFHYGLETKYRYNFGIVGCEGIDLEKEFKEYIDFMKKGLEVYKKGQQK